MCPVYSTTGRWWLRSAALLSLYPGKLAVSRVTPRTKLFIADFCSHPASAISDLILRDNGHAFPWSPIYGRIEAVEALTN